MHKVLKRLLLRASDAEWLRASKTKRLGPKLRWVARAHADGFVVLQYRGVEAVILAAFNNAPGALDIELALPRTTHDARVVLELKENDSDANACAAVVFRHETTQSRTAARGW